MPRQFRLLSTHYIDDMLLEEGTIIGEGTKVPFLHPDGSPRLPSSEMEGLDPAAQAEVDKIAARTDWGTNPVESLPVTLDGGPNPKRA